MRTWCGRGREVDRVQQLAQGLKEEAMLLDSRPQPYGEIFAMREDGSDVHQLTDNQWEDATARVASARSRAVERPGARPLCRVAIAANLANLQNRDRQGRPLKRAGYQGAERLPGLPGSAAEPVQQRDDLGGFPPSWRLDRIALCQNVTSLGIRRRGLVVSGKTSIGRQSCQTFRSAKSRSWGLSSRGTPARVCRTGNPEGLLRTLPSWARADLLDGLGNQ